MALRKQCFVIILLIQVQLLFSVNCSHEIVQDGRILGISSEKTRNKRGSINFSDGRLYLTLDPFFSKVHQEIARNGGDNENSVWSPYGLSVMLGMLYVGAGGGTASEMKTVLGLNGLEDQEILRKFRAIGKSQNSVKHQLSIANKAFASTVPNFAIRNKYKKRLRQIFRGGIEKINFMDAENAAKEINTWVKKETQDKIQTIIQADSIKPETRMVLVNAIYFKGKWETPFPSRNTRKMPFYTTTSSLHPKGQPSDDQFVETSFMNLRSHFYHGFISELNATVVKMPYKGNRFSMIAILPDPSSNISSLEERITQGFELHPIISSLNQGDLLLTFPKFKIESKTSFEETLPDVGIREIFTHRANFSQITPANDIFVKDILQRTFIEVTEEGTEAAAVTAAMLEARSMPRRVAFNRPFIGLIFDEKTNCILFLFRKVK